MQPERTDLEPPKDDPFTQEQLKAYDGTDPSKPVYVAIKGTYQSFIRLPLSLFTPLSLATLRRLLLYVYDTGTIFDVSRKRETYGPGGSYAILAGKDGSRALGLSSLKPEDAVPDWSTLEEKDRKTLNDWHTFFTCVVSFKARCLGIDSRRSVYLRKRYNIVGRVVDLPAAVANK
jgi:predicted heme/steroid binding protein